MSLHPIVKLANGRIDYEYERELTTLWFNEKKIQWGRVEDNTRRGFYLISKRNRNNKVYICCTSNIGSKGNPFFWFGLEHIYFQANPDMGLILVCVWENKVREYICFPNSFVRLWVNYWYKKNDYYSIDIELRGGEYRMKYPKNYLVINEFVNASNKLFTKINLFE